MNRFQNKLFLRPLLWRAAIACAALTTVSVHPTPAAESDPGIQLELVPIPVGFRESAFGDDPAKARQTAVYKAAASVNVTLPDDADPVFHTAWANNRFFYLFYNVATIDGDSSPLLVQRLHRQVTNYAADDAPPETTDQYMVEAFKCADGRMKRPDQHFGRYAIRRWAKRVFETTFEIGVPAETYLDNGGQWPFDPGRLYREISADSESRVDYDAVEFTRAVRWTLRVEFDAEGNYSVESPELGVRIVRQCPSPVEESESRPPTDVATDADATLLTAGRGVDGFTIGQTTEAELRAARGEPTDTRVFAGGASRTLTYDDGLAFNFARGRLNTVIAADGYAGRTAKGARLGDARARIESLYGKPAQETPGFLMFDGVGFWIDSRGNAVKIVLTAPR